MLTDGWLVFAALSYCLSEILAMSPASGVDRTLAATKALDEVKISCSQLIFASVGMAIVDM